MIVGRVHSPIAAHLDEMIKASYTLFDEDVCDRITDYDVILYFDISGLDLMETLFASCQSQGLHLSMVVGFAHDRVLYKASLVAREFYTHQCVHLYHILLHEIKNNTNTMREALMAHLHQLPHDDYLTLKKYIQYHLNASLAADALYVHRNTFNYRLDKAIAASGINVKVFPFAVLLHILFTSEELR